MAAEERARSVDRVDEGEADPTEKTADGSEGPPPGGQSPSSTDDGDDPRRVAHELLAQAHAVLTIAVRDDVLREWCPPGLELVVAQTAAKVAVAVGGSVLLSTA